MLGGFQAASGETLLQQVFPGKLIDLDTGGALTTGAFDSARAKLKVTETSDGNSRFSIQVKYIDTDFANRKFGSHLHTDKCVTDGAGVTGAHYKDPDLSFPENEVWFELTPNNEGEAVYTTVVPFAPEDENGAMSVVIHTGPTLADGSAGPKEVCLPLDVTTTWGQDMETQ